MSDQEYREFQMHPFKVRIDRDMLIQPTQISEQYMRRMADATMQDITREFERTVYVDSSHNMMTADSSASMCASDVTMESVTKAIETLGNGPAIICTTHAIWSEMKRELELDGIKTPIDSWHQDAIRVDGMLVKLFDTMREALDEKKRLGSRAIVVAEYRTKDGDCVHDESGVNRQIFPAHWNRFNQ